MGRPKKILIRQWREDDRGPMRRFLMQYLREPSSGTEFVASVANVRQLWCLGLAWSGSGEPTLLAERHGKIVAWTLWGPEAPSLLQREHRTCLGLVTFVAPPHRSQGIGKQLQQAAIAVATEKHYDRVVATVLLAFEHGLRNALGSGFQPIAQQLEVNINGMVSRSSPIHRSRR